jgi:hypothetical protein
MMLGVDFQLLDAKFSFMCRPIWCTGGRYLDPPTWPLTLVGDPWWTILWQSRLIWTFDISCQWEDFIHNPNNLDFFTI